MLIYKLETLPWASRNANVDKNLLYKVEKAKESTERSPHTVLDESKTEKNESTSEIHCEFSLAAGKHISGTLLLISETDGALSRSDSACSQQGDQ